MENNIFVKCDCHSEGVEVTYELEKDGTKEFWLAFYMWGRKGYKLSWGRRFKYIWMVITGQDLYGDMVILDEEKTRELVNFLKEKLDS